MASAVATGVLALLTLFYLIAAIASAKAAKDTAATAVEAARISNRQLQLQQRPVLVLGRSDNPSAIPTPFRFFDGTQDRVTEGHILARQDPSTGFGYIAFHVRNVGTSIALLKVIYHFEETSAPDFPPKIDFSHWDPSNKLLLPLNESRVYNWLGGGEFGGDEFAAAIGEGMTLVFDFVYTDLGGVRVASTRAILEMDSHDHAYHPRFGGYEQFDIERQG